MYMNKALGAFEISASISKIHTRKVDFTILFVSMSLPVVACLANTDETSECETNE